MGLETRNEGKYITILNGKFCQRVQEGTEGAERRVNKLGNVVWEKFYPAFSGKLVGIYVKEGGQYGKTWNFEFQDTQDVYTLQLSYSNSFATAFLKMLPNIDLSKEMRLSPSVKEVDGKRQSSLFVNQDGKAIKHAYTKENPNGMPDLKQIVVKGETMWDDTDRIAFLHDMVTKKIIPQLPERKVVVPQAPVDEAEKQWQALGGESTEPTAEDVPF